MLKWMIIAIMHVSTFNTQGFHCHDHMLWDNSSGAALDEIESQQQAM